MSTQVDDLLRNIKPELFHEEMRRLNPLLKPLGFAVQFDSQGNCRGRIIDVTTGMIEYVYDGYAWYRRL